VSPRVEILLPTHDHALMLPLAIATAQEQTVPPARIVVIGDGVGDDTRDVMAALCREDADTVFVDLPKAGRTGERHRHRVLVDSEADIVTYLSDDDLMFPDHVERMVALIEHCDVALPMGSHLLPDGVVESSPWSLGEEPGRTMACKGTSLFSLSGLSHTMASYRRLPHGWRDTPEGFYTDQYMLLQFLHEDWCRFDVSDVPTIVHLADSLRRDMSPSQRFDELRDVADRMRRRGGWTEYRRLVQSHLRRTAAQLMVDMNSAAEHVGDLSRRNDDLAAQVGELETRHVELTARSEELAAELSDLRRSYDERCAELDALMGTRTMRARNAFVRSRVMRALLSRRR
jgi:glycosyltransferase involved in cell wall biosynthesis